MRRSSLIAISICRSVKFVIGLSCDKWILEISRWSDNILTFVLISFSPRPRSARRLKMKTEVLVTTDCVADICPLMPEWSEAEQLHVQSRTLGADQLPSPFRRWLSSISFSPRLKLDMLFATSAMSPDPAMMDIIFFRRKGLQNLIVRMINRYYGKVTGFGLPEAQQPTRRLYRRVRVNGHIHKKDLRTSFLKVYCCCGDTETGGHDLARMIGVRTSDNRSLALCRGMLRPHRYQIETQVD